jgi:hypothetical protein
VRRVSTLPAHAGDHRGIPSTWKLKTQSRNDCGRCAVIAVGAVALVCFLALTLVWFVRHAPCFLGRAIACTGAFLAFALAFIAVYLVL